MGFVEGTTHVTYVRKKGKTRRERRKCMYYLGGGLCGSVSKCSGSAHCSIYITEEDFMAKQKRDAILKQKKEAAAKKERLREISKSDCQKYKIVFYHGKPEINTKQAIRRTLLINSGKKKNLEIQLLMDMKTMTAYCSEVYMKHANIIKRHFQQEKADGNKKE